MNAENENWYRAGAVAKMLDTSPHTIRELSRAGLIQSKVLNGYRYIPAAKSTASKPKACHRCQLALIPSPIVPSPPRQNPNGPRAREAQLRSCTPSRRSN